jgi:hypothetical protein
MENNQTGPGAEKAVVSTGTMEAVMAIAFMAFGGLVMYDSVRLGHSWGDSGPEAGYFPFYISVLLLLAGGATLLKTLLSKEEREKNAKPFVTWGRFKSVLALFFPLVIYILAMSYIGIYAAAMLFIGLFMRFNGKYGLSKVLPIAIGVPVMVFVLFEMWFLVPLPKGPIEALLGF